jgi:hypothetical protein
MAALSILLSLICQQDRAAGQILKSPSPAENWEKGEN